jgi:HAD superfamily hydrolase (TIGR01549 family)
MALERSRIRALCFDVDGTLRDTDDSIVNRLASLLRPARFLFKDRDPRLFARRLLMAAEDPATLLYRLPDWLQIDHHLARGSDWLHQTGFSRAKGPYLLIEGVQDLLASLSSEYPLSVVSARGRHGTQAFLDYFGLTRYFTAVASSQTCRHTKPYPDPVLWAAERMSVPPEACLMIGDTTVDMRAGKAAGAQAVGVLCGFGERGELLRSGADMILETTPELARILLKPA